jgi:hypothetical protein
MFMGLNIYNNPKIIFEQIWDKNYISNNRTKSFYNMFDYECWNTKMIRIFNNEYTFGDLVLLWFLLLVLSIFLIFLSIITKTYRIFDIIIDKKINFDNFQKIEFE